MNIKSINKALIPIAAICIAVTGCQTTPNQPQVIKQPTIAKPIISEEEKQQNEQNARFLFARYAQLELESSPMMQAYRGLKTNYDQWDNLTETFSDQQQQKAVALLNQAKVINRAALTPNVRLSLELLVFELEQSISFYPYRHYNYPVNSLYGLHTEIPNFLINIHQIHNIQDARDYITRIEKLPELIDQLIDQLKIRENKGILPPRFVFDTVLKACNDLLNGYPISKSQRKKHILWSNFTQNMENLKLYRSSEAVLEKKLKRALQKKFKPAYSKLISYLETAKDKASQDTGFHQFTQGLDYYHLRLQHITTLNTQADEIHQLGLQKIQSIHQAILDLIPKLAPELITGKKGKKNAKEPTDDELLQALFSLTRKNKSLYYKSGKSALNDSKQYIQRINQTIGNAFVDVPDIPMQIKPVEDFRSGNAPIAFYQAPSDDGSRPATYYMNFKKLGDMPKFQFEALAYHETLPGHHLQTIYALQAKELPEFRRHAHFTAYSEGWALYAEGLGKDLGGYTNPWNEYGRLLMALWRANRLVIDTGLHAKGWTMEDALQFRLLNTPFSKADSINAIQRYLVMPGQATAYMMGQIQFNKLKAKAETQLGEAFNLGEYHKFILELGPLPLTVLEHQVDQYIQTQLK